MELGLTYWIVAWILMATAFVTAMSAILIGAKNLDRASQKRRDEKHHL